MVRKPESSLTRSAKLTTTGKRRGTAYRNGRPICSTVRPVGQAMTVIGGDRDANSLWFIVIQRDEPSVVLRLQVPRAPFGHASTQAHSCPRQRG